MKPLQAACLASAERLGEFTARQLSITAEVGYDTATTWLKRWRRAGLVSLVGKDDQNCNIWRVRGAEKPADAKAFPASAERNMWWSMKTQRLGFRPTDIVALSSTGDIVVTADQVRAYCQMLTRAGYLRVERKAQPGVREAIYRLVKDTGPRPPRQRRISVVWDDNLSRITHFSEGAA